VLLAAESALRCGAGLVSAATRVEHVPALLGRCPEVMAHGVASANQLLALAERASVLVLGPGLGQRAWGRSLLSAVRSRPLPQVWDADALNLLALEPVGAGPQTWILTPHPGEAARLLGRSTAEVQADRPAAALELARLMGLRSQEAVQSMQSLKTWKYAIERSDTRLTVVFGTKGGRPRKTVILDTIAVRKALDNALAIAESRHGRLIDKPDLKSAIDYWHNQAARIG
ncbi:integrase domain-containing protein, partial [Pseudomonas aeruginosa]|nr:integrase domain-containing protein [Pseudomonas aeruginosa]